MSFDAEEYLSYFGFDRITNHDEDNVMASCFQGEMHSNEDRKRSFGILKHEKRIGTQIIPAGTANCYVCGGWTLEQLTRDLLNRQEEIRGTGKTWNEYEAMLFLQEKGWLDDEDSIEDIRSEFEGMDGIEFKKIPSSVEYLDESVLDIFLTSMHKRTLQRGDTLNAISVEVARQFKLGYDKVTKRIIIPVFTDKNKLVGVTSRATLDTDFIRYGIGTINPDWLMASWQNREYDGEQMIYVFDKRNYVYGEHTWYDEQGYLKHDRILVLESPLDVVYAYSQGLHEFMNIGAIFGSKMTKEQKEKILRHNTIIEGLDNDMPGMEGREKFHKDVIGKCSLYLFDSYGKKDLGNCIPEEVQQAMIRFRPFEESLFDGLEMELE